MNRDGPNPTEPNSTDTPSPDDGSGPNTRLSASPRSVLWDFVKPAAKAALLSTATLAGTAADGADGPGTD